MSELAKYEADGKVSDIQSFWIVNAVYCKATAAVIQAVADRADVWFVEWNLIPTKNALALAGAATAPADGTDNPEWNVHMVKADSVWHVYGYMGENVIVGHIDTGCDYTHPDLAGHMWTDANYPYHGWDFENNDNDPMDAQGHGTHTAGTVASDGTGRRHLRHGTEGADNELPDEDEHRHAVPGHGGGEYGNELDAVLRGAARIAREPRPAPDDEPRLVPLLEPAAGRMARCRDERGGCGPALLHRQRQRGRRQPAGQRTDAGRLPGSVEAPSRAGRWPERRDIDRCDRQRGQPCQLLVHRAGHLDRGCAV